MRRLRGTMLERTWQPVLANTFVPPRSCSSSARAPQANVRTPIWRAPPREELAVARAADRARQGLALPQTLRDVHALLFLNQSVLLFSRTLNLGRKIQGRLNDLGRCAHRAQRDGASGALDPAARATLGASRATCASSRCSSTPGSRAATRSCARRAASTAVARGALCRRGARCRRNGGLPRRSGTGSARLDRAAPPRRADDGPRGDRTGPGCSSTSARARAAGARRRRSATSSPTASRPCRTSTSCRF